MGYTTFQSNMLGIPSAVLQIISESPFLRANTVLMRLILSHAAAQLLVRLLQGKDLVSACDKLANLVINSAICVPGTVSSVKPGLSLA